MPPESESHPLATEIAAPEPTPSYDAKAPYSTGTTEKSDYTPSVTAQELNDVRKQARDYAISRKMVQTGVKDGKLSQPEALKRVADFRNLFPSDNYKRTVAHEVGHRLSLSTRNLAQGKGHDLPPYSELSKGGAWVYKTFGLAFGYSKQQDKNDLGKWLRQEDWNAANASAVALKGGAQ